MAPLDVRKWLSENNNSNKRLNNSGLLVSSYAFNIVSKGFLLFRVKVVVADQTFLGLAAC